MPRTFAQNARRAQPVSAAALADFDVESLARVLVGHGFLPVHAARILRGFYRRHGEFDFESVTVGKVLGGWLREHVRVCRSRVLRRHASRDGTVKLLVEFDGDGGGAVETVVMPSHRADRAAACVSSQVGCAMGCDFCASTREGLERDLEAGEIAEQYLHAAREAASGGHGRRRVASVVFMGMGEPLLNFDNVIGAVKRIGDPLLGAGGPGGGPGP